MKKILIPLFILAFTPSAFADGAKRIVSVGGAITETIFALNQQERLVGSDTTSYFPKAAAELPKVGYQRALSTEGILSLKPELIITTDEAGPPPVLHQLQAAGVKLALLKAPREMDDVKANITDIGKLLQAEDNAIALNNKIDLALKKLAEIKAASPEKVRVMFVMNHGNGAPMVAGRETAADSIIELSGAENVVKDYDRYKPLTPEAAVSYAPDVILVSDMTLEQLGGKSKLFDLPGLGQTPAAKGEHVVSMDALLLLGFGPRTADAAIELHQKLNKK